VQPFHPTHNLKPYNIFLWCTCIVDPAEEQGYLILQLPNLLELAAG
jgi:hypothetical protein